jgi:hypothetical protein
MENATQLIFSIKAVRALVRHAQSASEHSAGYGKDPVPALMLVKDEGIYLMSSGVPVARPPLRESNGPVYARGYDPKKNSDVWEASRAAVGGDDFVEVVPLDDALVAMIDAKEAEAFVVFVGPTTFEVGTIRSPRRSAERIARIRAKLKQGPARPTRNQRNP